VTFLLLRVRLGFGVVGFGSISVIAFYVVGFSKEETSGEHFVGVGGVIGKSDRLTSPDLPDGSTTLRM